MPVSPQWEYLTVLVSTELLDYEELHPKSVNGQELESWKQIGRTPLTGGRAQSQLTRATSWSFRSGRIRQRLRPRATSLLRNGQGRRSDFVAQQFQDTPDVIGQATGHRRSTWHPEASFLDRLTQFMMRPAKVVRTSNEIHSRMKSMKFGGGMTAFAG